jgi:hypothetical protein
VTGKNYLTWLVEIKNSFLFKIQPFETSATHPPQDEGGASYPRATTPLIRMLVRPHGERPRITDDISPVARRIIG